MKILTNREYINKRTKLMSEGLAFEEAKSKLDRQYTTKLRLASN